ncbi:MAG: DUF5009 domain-containing protein [Bacteroidales bacterium]|jgi:predicted acyltransferase|nr:DUF5009 domain-containing protein [Bacteroidales bacterium]MDD2264842.1 DUF5009 domain-containing protein [Bacteroidales bacterium]MDD2832060.1 DUF5009 domain-containing protein [Bacteroidales bacterium]MDD3208746.1 DUF5009 domain-containing protein [Bacteroidales bacterium]MDD3697309.1 DUF5009 domain-containing protein [Bacteroidales bacterium]
MKRFVTLDILRGLSIFGMVFSAIIPYGVLPPWMYHIQNPPPEHTLDMTSYGLGWVDLVFPIFIFCMGAAIPFAFRAKWERFGQDTRRDMKDIGERFLMLLVFSFLCNLLQPPLPGYGSQFLILAGFGALWLIYVKGASLKIRIVGWVAALSLLALYAFVFDMGITLFSRNIIILLLAFLYLFGALIWYFTRNSVKWRLVAFLGVILMSLVSRWVGFDGLLYGNKNISWLLNMEEINLLMILLPATWVGDRLLAMQEEHETGIPRGGFLIHLLFWGMFLLVIWILVSSYNRWLSDGKSFSFLTLLVLVWLMRKKAPQFLSLLYLSGLLILTGMWIERFEPGLTKVPCSFSYCFVSGGVAILLLLWLHYLSEFLPRRFLSNIFAGAGANPLMSYVAYGMFVVPLMKITYLQVLYHWARPVDYPWIGTLSAFLLVLFTMWLVSLITRKKIYWRA